MAHIENQQLTHLCKLLIFSFHEIHTNCVSHTGGIEPVCGFWNYGRRICKDYHHKNTPSGGDNLENKKPEREYEYVARILRFCDFASPGMQLTASLPAFNR